MTISKRWIFFIALLAALASGLTFAQQAEQSVIAPDQRRSVEQTFLTYPEWFLVHSPAELARVIAKRPAHDFPFITHIKQLWSSYGNVISEQVRQSYPANVGYHVMILVIAGSTTIEYGLRAAYENTVGRVSWLFSSGHLSQEDLYAAEVAQEYVDFIREKPWYLFNFSDKLKKLWSTVPAWGPGMVRKWERRYALSTEYLIKAIYGKLIEQATRATYDPALMTTRVQVDRFPDNIRIDKVNVIKKLPDGSAILDLPRYFNFQIAAAALAQHHIQFIDIAGNKSVILITAWTSKDNHHFPWRKLFEQSLATQPDKKRVALIVPVNQLSQFLISAPSQQLSVEHIYDY